MFQVYLTYIAAFLVSFATRAGFDADEAFSQSLASDKWYQSTFGAYPGIFDTSIAFAFPLPIKAGRLMYFQLAPGNNLGQSGANAAWIKNTGTLQESWRIGVDALIYNNLSSALPFVDDTAFMELDAVIY
jgi:hypothetical protein